MTSDLQAAAERVKHLRHLPDYRYADGSHVPTAMGRDPVAITANEYSSLLDIRDAALAELAALRTENAELRTETKEMRKLAQLGTHRVIACGVAATNPDASLVERGAYADKWRTQQLDEVKALRRDRDNLQQQLAALRARCEGLEAALKAAKGLPEIERQIRDATIGGYDEIGDGFVRERAEVLSQVDSALAALKEAPRA